LRKGSALLERGECSELRACTACT